MASRNYSERTLKRLFGRAGRCAFPACPHPIVDDARGTDVIVAQIAHIHGLELGSERYVEEMTDRERNEYDNLILLCGTHHNAYVDGALGVYSADELRAWKRTQEEWLEERLRADMPKVTFAELEVVMKAVVASSNGLPVTLTLVAPAQKMAKNGLTSKCGIAMGLTKAPEVRDLLQQFAKIDSGFPDRLRAGFVAEYQRLHSDGERGDELFLSLRVFAAGGHEPVMHDAALAVLSYLFEACEVFER